MEAAEACLQYAFTVLMLDEVVSFTSVLNKPSEHLMKRLGMKKWKSFRIQRCRQIIGCPCMFCIESKRFLYWLILKAKDENERQYSSKDSEGM